MSGDTTSYLPTDGLTYDPKDPKYWDESALAKEIDRAFDICHGCRMCFKYCDAFPKLFDIADDNHEGDATKLTAAEKDAVVDDCFQCKLCDVQCPYTPRDGHEFQLDLPKLIHRYNAVRTKKRGVALRDKVLGDPDFTAKMARASLGMANAMNRVKVHRWFMEKVLGIHRDKNLPDFAGKTFSKWAKGKGLIKDEPGGEVVLFQTCFVENNDPQIGKDTVEVFEANGVDLRCEKGLECCGMPAWETGDLERLRKHAKQNLNRLMPHVEKGAKVAVVNPTCSMMLRREYPELVAEEDRERAEKLSEAVRDCGEFLWEIRKEERFNSEFKSSPEKISYHAPCHLRAQAVGFRGRDLIKKIGVQQVAFVPECCGHDGTFGMKVESYEASIRVGKKSFDAMKAPDSEVWATECPLAAMHFEQHAGKKAMHPMSILAQSYRGQSFAPPAKGKPKNEEEE